MQADKPGKETSHALSWDRPADPVEEAAHAASHLVGCALALAVWSSLAHPPGLDITSLPVAGSTLFVATMLLMFVASASYHAARPADQDPPAAARPRGDLPVHRRQLHAVRAGGARAQALLAAVWSVALLGMALKLADRLRHRGWSTARTWCSAWWGRCPSALQRVPPLTQGLGARRGLCYGGLRFLRASMRMRWGHLLWHLMVIVGSTCHVAALMMAQ